MDGTNTVALVGMVAVGMVAVLGLFTVAGWFLRSRRERAVMASFAADDRDDALSVWANGHRNGDGNCHNLHIEPLRIRELSRTERQYFVESWAALQSTFVDDPQGAVATADSLIQEVMVRRGYPVQDLDPINSAQHSKVLLNYRKAHEIATQEDTASTERLREAVIRYRTLFADLVQIEEPVAQPTV